MVRIPEVQHLEEALSRNVAEEVDVLNVLNAGPEAIGVGVGGGTQESLDDHVMK